MTHAQLHISAAGIYERARRAHCYLPQEKHRAVVTLLELCGEWLRTGDRGALITAEAIDRRLRHPAGLRPGVCWLLAAECLLWLCSAIARGADADDAASYVTSAERMLLRAEGLRGQS